MDPGVILARGVPHTSVVITQASVFHRTDDWDAEFCCNSVIGFVKEHVHIACA